MGPVLTIIRLLGGEVPVISRSELLTIASSLGESMVSCESIVDDISSGVGVIVGVESVEGVTKVVGLGLDKLEAF